MDRELVAQVVLERGHLTAQLKNLKQKDWIKACEKLGLWVPRDSGRGSHCCAYVAEHCDRSNNANLVITIQKKLIPNVQPGNFKSLVAYGTYSQRYTEDEV